MRSIYIVASASIRETEHVSAAILSICQKDFIKLSRPHRNLNRILPRVGKQGVRNATDINSPLSLRKTIGGRLSSHHPSRHFWRANVISCQEKVMILQLQCDAALGTGRMFLKGVS